VSERQIGRDIERLDGRKKVTGTATYAAETEVAHVVHGVIVGARIARGRITALDTTAAEKAPGVVKVLTHTNAPRLPNAAGKDKPNDRVVQLLQDAEVRYHDQPIALVVADTLERAQYAANLVVATYEELKPVADLSDDIASAVAAPGGGRHPPVTSRGDLDAGLRAAAVRVDVTYTTAVETHNPMEPHATIAVWRGDELTLYDSTQGIFAVRARLARIFEVPPEQVRVISHFVGGGFGGKGAPWSHVGLAAMAARVTGRAVKVVCTRQQLQSLVGHRPKTVQDVTLGADRKGALTVIHHATVSETSRFDQFTEVCGAITRMLYACPVVHTSHKLVPIDVGTPTFQRAPGESTGSFALESAMDELAEQLAIDPLELRRRNHAASDLNEGKPWSSKSLLECYRRGAERFGWSRRDARPRATRDGTVLVGSGMASATRPSTQQPASARARIARDGTVLVQAGTQDIGTGTYTIMTQVAADALGLPIDQVRFELGDTTFPETPSSVGSFTAASTGAAVARAARDLRAKMIELAIADERSPLYRLTAGAVSAGDGALFATAEPSRRDPFSTIVTRTGGSDITVEARTEASEERNKYSIHAFGAIFAEVRVDEDIGEIRLSRLLGAFAAGKILNPRTARSQLIGGMVWGVGMALHEHASRDPRTARMMARDLADYHIPVNADLPDIDVILVDEEDPFVNEIGAKGLGEVSTPGVAAAIANAIHHATGKRIREIPIRCEHVLRTS
jgi:xanthine dehydrogenase YagR molybdenum-binding subunit